MPGATVLLTSGFSITDGASFPSASIAPTANRLVLATVRARIGTGSCPTPTPSGGGLTNWVLLGTPVDIAGTTQQREFLFGALSASPGSGAVTFDFGVTMQNCSWSIGEIPDVNATGGLVNSAVVQYARNNGGAGLTSLTVTLAALQNALNATYGAVSLTANIAVTPGTGYGELHEVQTGGAGADAATLETEYRTDGQTAVGWTFASANAGGCAIEIRDVTVPAGGLSAGIIAALDDDQGGED